MTKRMLVSIWLALLVPAIGCSPKAADRAAAVEKAGQAAREWLNLVDAGNYEESWKQAAGFFRSRITDQQ